MYTRIESIIDNFLVLVKAIPKQAIRNIPFFSQWESMELVDKILSHEIEASQDPKWKNSGAKSKEDYLVWSWNLCGTACLKMILKFQTGKDYRLFDLANNITKFGGYLPRLDGTVDGLFYKPFTKYLKKQLKINSKIVNPLNLRRIKYETSQGNYVICSVNQTIRNEQAPTPPIKTGHLILISGYDDSKSVFYINNPSGYYKKSQFNHQISYKDFKRFYSGRGIVIYRQ